MYSWSESETKMHIMVKRMTQYETFISGRSNLEKINLCSVTTLHVNFEYLLFLYLKNPECPCKFCVPLWHQH